MVSRPYVVYMVRCDDDTLYTGITTNLERRLRQHNGEVRGGAKYTKGKSPVHLVYVEKHKNRSEASKREYEIKNNYTRKEKGMLIATQTKETF